MYNDLVLNQNVDLRAQQQEQNALWKNGSCTNCKSDWWSVVGSLVLFEHHGGNAVGGFRRYLRGIGSAFGGFQITVN